MPQCLSSWFIEDIYCYNVILLCLLKFLHNYRRFFPIISLSQCLSYCFSQVKLHFTENALRLIAKKAISKNTGARGLRSLLENILMDAMYEVCRA